MTTSTAVRRNRIIIVNEEGKLRNETTECGAATIVLAIPVAGDFFSKAAHESDCLLALIRLQHGL
jgi:hypothetical protein